MKAASKKKKAAPAASSVSKKGKGTKKPAALAARPPTDFENEIFAAQNRLRTDPLSYIPYLEERLSKF